MMCQQPERRLKEVLEYTLRTVDAPSVEVAMGLVRTLQETGEKVGKTHALDFQWAETERMVTSIREVVRFACMSADV